ncbi:hypothetical protein FR943_08060 [Mycobacterium sp. TNTM28]|uniref:Uncharacterized protein n=1 Tax=[Mycobacterium] fortunisiensis TaxID=2600579 RepID=A0ABS6KJK8_9MYCO|nr:hypothetical protein [[Mycobacterium] fortunisiensis]MBU9763794.1 hypothetical protein [[Mycobacterium] fortunisiensis]
MDTLAEYVAAAHLLGFQHPDLTAQPGAMYDRYRTEEGLDLGALEADRAALVAAAAVAEQALRLQHDQVDALSAAWQGAGAAASQTFLTHHAAASEQTVAALRTAADALGTLGERLWQAIEDKVAAAIDIEQSCASHRELWLAAARTVRSGVGERDTAAELVDQQVKPFVAEHVGGEWLTAMRTATATVADAYAAALGMIRGAPVPVFAVPGQLGPLVSPQARPAPAPESTAVRPAAAQLPEHSVPPYFSPTAPSAPAGAPAAPAGYLGGAAPAAPAPVAPAAAPAGLAAASPPGTSMPSVDPGAGGLSSGLAGAGSGLAGLGGLGQRLADMFGGLVGADSGADGGYEDNPFRREGLGDDEPEKLFDDDDDEAEDDTGDEDDEDDVIDEGDEGEDDEAAVAEGEAADEEGEPDEPEGQERQEAESPETRAIPLEPPAPTPVPASPSPPAATPQSAPVPDPQTPCEIAADELPQVGG